MSQSKLDHFFGKKAINSSETNKIKTTNNYVETLISLNKKGTGKLSRNTKTNVYLDKRYPFRIKRAGITKKLRKRYYSNYRPLEKVRRVRCSSMKIGSRFHKHVFHKIMCNNPSNKCICLHKYDSKTHSKRIQRGSIMDQWLKHLWDVFDQKSIVPFACEVIVSNKNISTEIDILAWESGGSYLVNISLKTGYSNRFKHPRTKDDTNKMLGQACDITNSDYEQHQLQQFIENKILKDGHSINVDKSYVIYVGMNKNKAVVEEPSSWRKNNIIKENIWNDINK